jgi:hypothetical protein
LNWWFKLLYTGKGLKESEIDSKSIEDIYDEVGFKDKDKDRLSLSQFNDGWGRRVNLKTIFFRIEKFSSWN